MTKGLSAFQLFKNSSRTNDNGWFNATPIIDYGRIIRIIDIQTVVVEAIVQNTLAKRVYSVTLLNLSSALLEISAAPQLGDIVLLLFLQYHDPRMFILPEVVNASATGYNRFSGVGILMSAMKSAANTTLRFSSDGDIPTAMLSSTARWGSVFNAGVSILFRRAVADNDDEAPINMLFGEGRRLRQQFLSKVSEEHGFWKDTENEWIRLDAAVTRRYSIYAPITEDIQGSQTFSIGLGTDKNDNPVETDAPITETIHGKSPITKNIRSPQSITIGFGNDESGNAEEQRNAHIDITLSGQADIDFKSGSGIKAEVERNVDVLIKGNETRDVVGNAKYTSADTDIESAAPIGIKGTETQLGGDVLQVFWDELIGAFDQYPVIIPPVPWPKGAAVPPAPPIINMALNGIKNEIIAAAVKAKASCAKSLK